MLQLCSLISIRYGAGFVLVVIVEVITDCTCGLHSVSNTLAAVQCNAGQADSSPTPQSRLCPIYECFSTIVRHCESHKGSPHSSSALLRALSIAQQKLTQTNPMVNQPSLRVAKAFSMPRLQRGNGLSSALWLWVWPSAKI